MGTLTREALSRVIYFITHLKLHLATATHNFKWVNITFVDFEIKHL